MHVVSLHGWSSYRRHSSPGTFEKTLQHSSGLLPGEKLTRGFRMLAGWRELAVILEGLWLAIRAEWGAIRIFLSSERLQQLLFARLELVPDPGVATLLLPVFVEDGQKVDWKGSGWGLGGNETRVKILLFYNHARHIRVPPRFRRHEILKVDTRKPWQPLEYEVRQLLPDAEPILYQLRKSRLNSFSPLENHVYRLKRNGAEDGQIRRALRIPGNRLSKVFASMAHKLGVQEGEIPCFEPNESHFALTQP